MDLGLLDFMSVRSFDSVPSCGIVDSFLEILAADGDQFRLPA